MIDLNTLKNQVSQILSYSQCNNQFTINADEIIDKWFESKSYFIEALGDKLIYEYPEQVSFHLNEEDKQIKLDNFIYLVNTKYHNIPLGNFLTAQRDGFWKNEVLTPYPLDDDEEISVGAKILKSFKKFEQDDNTIQILQSKASELIQQNCIEGKLCISVHPLDFLSCGENNYHWRTCLALDGSYRAGSISFMMDNSSFICYLKGKDNVKLPLFPENVLWNDKKWRAFMFMSTDNNLIFSGRHYPFFSTDALEIIKDCLFSQINLYTPNWSNWHDDHLNSYAYKNGIINWLAYTYYPIGNYLIPLNGSKNCLVEDTPKSLHFNDIINSSCYNPYYIFNKVEMAKMPKIKLGATFNCLLCKNNLVTENDTMFCTTCNENNKIKNQIEIEI